MQVGSYSDIWNPWREEKYIGKKIWRNNGWNIPKFDENYRNSTNPKYQKWKKKKKNLAEHIIIKLLKISGKKKILKADRGKKHIIYKKQDNNYSKFCVRNNARYKRVSNIFKVLKQSVYNSMPTENIFQKQRWYSNNKCACTHRLI